MSGLEELIDRAMGSATVARTSSVGPIPLSIRADCQQAIDDVEAVLVGSAHPGWSTLDLVLVDERTIPASALPTSIRPTGDLRRANDGAITVISERSTDCVWFLDEERGRALRWFAGVGTPPGEREQPLRCAVRWWGQRHASALVHSGAVATSNAAALLVGASGSGKSTTAMAAGAGGLTVLGDDYCLVEVPMGGTAVVHALYGVAKLSDSSLEVLPALAPRVVGRGWGGKHLVRTGTEQSSPVPLRAICSLRQRPGEPAVLEPASPVEVLRSALVHSAITTGLDDRDATAAVIRAVRDTPVRRLVVGEPRSVVPLLHALLAD